MSTDRPNCTDDEVRCQGGRCIPQTALCDLKNDCGDNSDETECSKFLDEKKALECLSFCYLHSLNRTTLI